MRAGRLKTRTYKTRRGGAGWIVLPLLLAALVALGIRLGREEWFLSASPTRLTPAPTLTPQESARESREVTLPGKSWYALEMSAYPRAQEAQQAAEALRRRGAAGYVYAKEQALILGAAYESRADAQQVQQQLLSLHQLETRIVEVDRPEITLRLSGQKAQLTALEDAMTFIDQLAGQLSALSQGLDARTLTQTEITGALASQRDTAEGLSARMQALFPAAEHAAVSEVQAMLKDLTGELGAALLQRGTALGAALKACQLLCVCRMAALADALAA